MSKAECVLNATWTSNRKDEWHVLLVIPGAKGGFELIPFEGGIKQLQGFAMVSEYQQTIVDGVEEENWKIVFDGKTVQGFEIALEDIVRSKAKGTLVEAMRSISMQKVQMQTQDGELLGKLPMAPLLHITDKQIRAAAERILKNSSPQEVAMRKAA